MKKIQKISKKIKKHVVGSKSNLESNESNINLNWKKFIIFTPI